MSKQKIIVLTGAGISAESGLKTFRDGDGLWENHRIEDVATPDAWRRNPEMVLRFYNMRRQDCLAAQPNAAHLGLAQLEQYYDVTIVTQNIDDLHERAGSGNVLHLHGEILKMRSERDEYRLYDIRKDIALGEKALDGGQFRPHVVWFHEPVPMIEPALELMQAADIFILVGTSLAVYPAAGLIDYVPDSVPKYIMDKNIPRINHLHNIIPIEKNATQGIEVLLNALIK
jgi:NAD-dependent deacetylase